MGAQCSALLSKINQGQVQKVAGLVFDKLDRDDSGEMDSQELGYAIQLVSKYLGLPPNSIPPAAIDKAIKAVDKNDNGLLDKEEFEELVAKLCEKAGVADEAGNPVV